MAFIEIFWATYAPYNLLIAHLKAGLPGLIYSVRPGWRAGQDEARRSPRRASSLRHGSPKVRAST
jgi:hypothetical protein